MTPCVWRILCLRNSSSVSYFRQPPNLPTAARRNRKCTECRTTDFGRNRMSAESAHLSTFGAETETEAEIRSTSSSYNSTLFTTGYLPPSTVNVPRGGEKSPAGLLLLLFHGYMSSVPMLPCVHCSPLYIAGSLILTYSLCTQDLPSH